MTKQSSIKFQCIICNNTFKDETDLNTHLLFEHQQWRGYCENPNSNTYFDEIKKLLQDLRIRFGTKQKRKGRRLLLFDVQQIMRLLDLGYEFPQFMKEFVHEYNKVKDQDWGFNVDNQSWHTRAIPTMMYSESSKEKQNDYIDRLDKEQELIKQFTKQLEDKKITKSDIS